MARPLVAGNWKMNLGPADAGALAAELRAPLEEVPVDTLVCPPFVSLPVVAAALAGSRVMLGAQNMHPEEKGAFTGEVSGQMLREVCSHVILGHSERRHGMGESDAFIHRKVRAALSVDLTPVLCLGETLEQREAGRAAEVCHVQLGAGHGGLTPEQMAQVVIAYEPVWAIGTGRAATPEIAQDIMGAVREELRRMAGTDTAEAMPLLYGGSVTAENIAGFAEQHDIDGALVGGASLQAVQFTAIARAVARAKRAA